MKKLFTLLVIIMMSLSIFAQAPQKMSYQCVVRNSSGALVTNHAAGVRITVLQGSSSGAVVYQETFNSLTNANGLVTVEIGGGTPITGTFSSINWMTGPYFLRTETDPSGGTSYTISGTSELLSVPYALNAKSASNYNESDPVFGASPAKGITSGNITNWNTAYGWGNHAGLYRPVSWVPTWGNVTDKPVFATVATSGSYNDLLNKPTILNSQWTTSGSNISYPGNVAIGLTLARYKLNLYGDDDASLGFFNSTSGTSGTDGFTIGTTSSGSPVWIWNYENSNMHFGTNNTRRLDILADGKVIIKGPLNINEGVAMGGALNVNSSQAIWWDGTYFSWGYDGTYNYFADRVTIGDPVDHSSYMLYVKGTAYATGSWSSSDASFKKNISTIDNSLDKVMKVRGTKFEFRTDEFKDYQFTDGPQFGFIAQELENVFPEVVKTESDGYKSVNYSGMIPVLLESIKEQQLQIESQQKQIDELKQAVELLKP